MTNENRTYTANVHQKQEAKGLTPNEMKLLTIVRESADPAKVMAVAIEMMTMMLDGKSEAEIKAHFGIA